MLHAEVVEPRDPPQKEQLFLTFEKLFSEIDIKWRHVSAIGVCTGPGYFNSIRASVAAARGLSLALHIPAVSVNRFEALYFGMKRPTLAVVSLPGGHLCCKFNSEQKPFFATVESLQLQRSDQVCVVGDRSQEISSRLNVQWQQPLVNTGHAVTAIAARNMDRPHNRPIPYYLKPPRVNTFYKPQPVNI